MCEFLCNLYILILNDYNAWCNTGFDNFNNAITGDGIY